MYYQRELNKKVEGPAQSLDGDLAAFDGISGKLIKKASSVPYSIVSGLSPSKIVVTDANGVLATGSATAIESGYLSGATSNIQHQINNLAASPSRFAIVAGAGGNLPTGKWLEIFSGNPSNSSPLVVAENSALKAISISTGAVTTATFTVFKNLIAIQTLSLTSQQRGSVKGLNDLITTDDEISIQVTDGSANDACFILFIETRSD